MLTAPVSFQAQTELVDKMALVKPVASSFAISSAQVMNIDIDQLGRVPVQLFPESAPHLVAALKGLAQHEATGRVHRAEAIPVAPSQGPPYALVQGSIDDPQKILAKMPH